MFGSIGGPELLLIFLVALLVFGPRKLPELGRMFGKGLAEFRRAAGELRESLETEVSRSESGRKETAAAAPPRTLPAAGTVEAGSSSPRLLGAADQGGPAAPASASDAAGSGDTGAAPAQAEAIESSTTPDAREPRDTR